MKEYFNVLLYKESITLSIHLIKNSVPKQIKDMDDSEKLIIRRTIHSIFIKQYIYKLLQTLKNLLILKVAKKSEELFSGRSKTISTVSFRLKNMKFLKTLYLTILQ